MAIGGFECHAVEGFELLDLLQGLRGERGFAFESVEDDALDQVAQGHVLLLGDGFEDLEHAFFEADASLDAFDFDERMILFFLRHLYQCTEVHRCAQGRFCGMRWTQWSSLANRRYACYGREGRKNDPTIGTRGHVE